MKNHRPLLAAFLILTVGAFHAHAGTISYLPIAASQSDANSGISTDNGYTSAVDGGNTRGTDRVINGITLYALSGSGQTGTADNCTLNALSGSLANGGGTTKSVQLDGTFREVLSDMTFNNGAGDNSQQEIVLDPESLEAGTTYDLRVYICNGSGQNRQVNLAFFGDGQAAVETGFFNEDDARTSAGGFKDQNQGYYINYRYTWDGDSTPGITITQKSGDAPFCLYALTNQVVPGGTTAATPAVGSPAAGAATAGEEAAQATGGEEGLSAGYTNENQESDQVGVSSDDFYGSESLNAHGKWVKLSKWGTCWQPTDVPSGWCPYTNGSFKQCDDCGWTFVSDEPWAWACYHYGRWCKVQTGCGWAWVPGKVWASSWVSWRRGRDESGCSCIGWAPLPPEAGCELGVGISTWVDNTCNIGPDCYTFINIRDFGSDSYSGCGCIYDHGRNTTVIIDTFNCTNISHTRWGTYCGGPDYNWCNTEIRKRGGKECGKVYVNRYDDPSKMGGKFSKHEGNQLGLLSPHIKAEKNPTHMPKTAESIGANKIDHGWNNVKDPKVKNDLKNKIAEESKGKNPKNAPAQLPPDVAQKVMKQHGGTGAGQPGGAAAGAGQAATQQLGGKGQHPGEKGHKGAATQSLVTGGQSPGAAPLNQHPGGKGKNKGQGQLGTAIAGQSPRGGQFDQHPGGKGKHKGQAQLGGAVAGGNPPSGGNQQATSFQGTRHPGQSLKGKGAQAGMGPTGAGSPGAATRSSALSQGGGGQHPGKQKGKGAQALGQTGTQPTGGGKQQGGAAQSLQGGTGQTAQGGGGQGGKGRHKQQQQQQQGAGQAAQGGTAQAQGGQGRHKQQQQQQLKQQKLLQQQVQQQQRLQQQQLQQQQLQQQQMQRQRLQQQQQVQRQRLQQQQQVQQQQQKQFQPQPGGGKKKPTPTPTPHR